MDKKANDTSSEERQSQQQEMQRTIGGSHEILLSATSIFPFTLFPDTITVDREKVSVTQRLFFRTAEVVSIRIEDVLNVTADVGPFMGSIKLFSYSRFFSRQPHVVNYLRRRDAVKIKRIIQGHIIALQRDIDTSALSTKELITMLDELGGTAPQDEL